MHNGKRLSEMTNDELRAELASRQPTTGTRKGWKITPWPAAEPDSDPIVREFPADVPVPAYTPINCD